MHGLSEKEEVNTNPSSANRLLHPMHAIVVSYVGGDEKTKHYNFGAGNTDNN